MRRHFLFGIGILETLLGVILLVIGSKMPHSDVIDQGFDRAGDMTHRTAEQIQLMRLEVNEIRQRNVPLLARQLRTHLDSVATNARASTIDFATVDAMSKALAASAKGLESWSDTMNAEKYLPALAGLANAADYLDSLQSLSEGRVATPIVKSAGRLGHDVYPCVLLQGPKIDARTNQEITQSLFCCADPKTFEKPQCEKEFRAFRQRLAGLESDLENSIEQVNVLSAVRFPEFSAKRLGGGIEMRPLWPEGRRTADELGQTLSALKGFNRKLGSIAPMLRDLGTAWEDGNSQTEKIAGSTANYSAAVREASENLRKVRQELERTLRTWPVLVETIHHSATVLNGSHRQLDSVLAQRVPFERAVDNSQEIAQTAANLFESSTANLDDRLDEQQQSLGQLLQSLNEVSDNLPDVKRAASNLLLTLRWMFWLVGGLIGLHGLFVVCLRPASRHLAI